MGDQTLTDDDDCRRSGLRVATDGATVVVSPTSPTSRATLRAGDSTRFELNGRLGELANPDPTRFFLNGVACRTD